MTKKLLFLSAFAASTCMYADGWEKPVYTGSFQPLTPDAEMYIYNTGAKQFLTEGNDWGTHASVDDRGLKVIVKTYADEGEEWDGKTYIISDYSLVKNNWYNMFITDGGGVYVDASSTATDIFFSFNDLGSNTYNIFGADRNPIWNTKGDMAGYIIGHYVNYHDSKNDIYSGTGVIYDYYGEDHSYGENEFNAVWTFVAPEDYAAYLEKLETYEAALQLGEEIKSAETMGVTGIDDEKNVYANTASTIDDIKAASETLNAKVLKYYEENVTPENPVDLTYMIENAECDNTSGWTNVILASTWENANMSAGWQTDWDEEAFTGSYLNIWGASLEGFVSQDIEGIPNGIYAFSVSALAQNEGATVYINENSKPLPADSKGHRYTIITNVLNGAINLGMSQGVTGENWMCLDNATLKYYGRGIEAYKFWLNELKETAKIEDGYIVQQALVDEYNEILNKVESADTEEKILGIVKDYEDIINRMATNAAAYDNLVRLSEEADDLTGLNEYYTGMLEDYFVETIQPIIESSDYPTLSTEEVNDLAKEYEGMIDEAQNYVWNKEKLESELMKAGDIYAECSETCTDAAAKAYNDFLTEYEEIDQSKVTNAELVSLLNDLFTIEFNLQIPDEKATDENPIDYTAKIYNPTFIGVDGWTNDGWSTFANNTWYGFDNEEGATTAGEDGNYLNLWNPGNANGYQQLAELPAGAYTVQFGAYADNEGFEVYANDESITIPVGQDDNGWRLRLYTIDVIVGEDGNLTLGARNTNGNVQWAMVDEFHIFYKGTESEIMTDVHDITPAASSNGNVYSITGVKVGNSLNGLAKGIYIKDGKKYNVK